MRTAGSARVANSGVNDPLGSHLDTPGAQFTDEVLVGCIGSQIYANIAKIWTLDCC